MTGDGRPARGAPRRRRSESALTVTLDHGVIEVRGELDLATAPILTEALQTAVQPGGVITLDVRGLSFIDSSGLKVLLDAARGLDGRGKLVLRSPVDAVVRVLEISGVIGHLPTLELETEKSIPE